MSRYGPLLATMTHNDPLLHTITQNIDIDTMTHYDPKLYKLFYNDPQ